MGSVSCFSDEREVTSCISSRGPGCVRGPHSPHTCSPEGLSTCLRIPVYIDPGCQGHSGPQRRASGHCGVGGEGDRHRLARASRWKQEWLGFVSVDPFQWLPSSLRCTRVGSLLVPRLSQGLQAYVCRGHLCCWPLSADTSPSGAMWCPHTRPQGAAPPWMPRKWEPRAGDDPALSQGLSQMRCLHPFVPGGSRPRLSSRPEPKQPPHPGSAIRPSTVTSRLTPESGPGFLLRPQLHSSVLRLTTSCASSPLCPLKTDLTGGVPRGSSENLQPRQSRQVGGQARICFSWFCEHSVP